MVAQVRRPAWRPPSGIGARPTRRRWLFYAPVPGAGQWPVASMARPNARRAGFGRAAANALERPAPPTGLALVRERAGPCVRYALAGDFRACWAALGGRSRARWPVRRPNRPARSLVSVFGLSRSGRANIQNRQPDEFAVPRMGLRGHSDPTLSVERARVGTARRLHYWIDDVTGHPAVARFSLVGRYLVTIRPLLAGKNFYRHRWQFRDVAPVASNLRAYRDEARGSLRRLGKPH